MRRMTIAVCIILLGLALGGAACAKKQPPPPPPPTRAELREAQARRWKDLAAMVAKDVQGALMLRSDLTYIPIYVRPPGDTTFAQTFRELLISELVLRGLRVSVQQEDALVLDFSVQENTVLTATLRYNNRYVLSTSKVEQLGDAGLGQAGKEAVWNRHAKRRPVYNP